MANLPRDYSIAIKFRFQGLNVDSKKRKKKKTFLPRRLIEWFLK